MGHPQIQDEGGPASPVVTPAKGESRVAAAHIPVPGTRSRGSRGSRECGYQASYSVISALVNGVFSNGSGQRADETAPIGGGGCNRCSSAPNNFGQQRFCSRCSRYSVSMRKKTSNKSNTDLQHPYTKTQSRWLLLPALMAAIAAVAIGYMMVNNEGVTLPAVQPPSRGIHDETGSLTEGAAEMDEGERLEQTLQSIFSKLDVNQDRKLDLQELDSDAAQALEIYELGGAVTMRQGKINGLVGMQQAFKIGDRDPTDASLSYGEWLDTFVVLVKFVKGAATAEEKQAIIFAMRDVVNDAPQTGRRCYAGPDICGKLDLKDAEGEMHRGEAVDEVQADELTADEFYEK